ncbi:MAG: Transferase [uncultured Sulfurovum sp.]|uniref:Transferase n=1 Tax=uncultured Sulfurovum sp. TaxID=269237 RepID=A0A6S6T5U0_9BACT|nr:MAG: Transferase [uncultured Sulfurovum sp.]
MDNIEQKSLVGLIYNLDTGGAERMMLTILNDCVDQGFEVHLVIFQYEGALLKELSPHITVHKLNKSSVSKGLVKCLKTVKHIHPHVVFTGIGHLNIALAPFLPIMKFLLPKTKWISRETNIVSLENQVSKYPKLFDFLYRHTYKNYDVIVAQSLDMKEDLLKNYFQTDKIVLINNPIDVKKIDTLSIEDPFYTFDESKINLLSVSRLREQKRIDLMLETLSHLPLNYHLTIVGSGEKEIALKALSIRLNLQNRVRFLGQQSNPYTYMKRADLLLLTSQREGFPNVLLEANTLGLPIVAFASLGGIQEIIEEGVNGFFVPFNKCELLAKKIEEAQRTKFDKNKIREATIQKYSKDNILNKYKNIFLK